MLGNYYRALHLVFVISKKGGSLEETKEHSSSYEQKEEAAHKLLPSSQNETSGEIGHRGADA